MVVSELGVRKIEAYDASVFSQSNDLVKFSAAESLYFLGAGLVASSRLYLSYSRVTSFKSMVGSIVVATEGVFF